MCRINRLLSLQHSQPMVATFLSEIPMKRSRLLGTLANGKLACGDLKKLIMGRFHSVGSSHLPVREGSEQDEVHRRIFQPQSLLSVVMHQRQARLVPMRTTSKSTPLESATGTVLRAISLILWYCHRHSGEKRERGIRDRRTFRDERQRQSTHR